MVSILLTVGFIETSRLNMAIFMNANPHIAISWRHRQRLDPVKLGLGANGFAARVEIAKSLPPAHACDAGIGVRYVNQPGMHLTAISL